MTMQAPLIARTPAATPARRGAWIERFRQVREQSLRLAAPLSAEDQQIQSMPDVSPTKWHLAHVTWFFETFLLEPALPGYRRFDPAYGYLFNSYYEQVGERHPRPQRGLLSRPALEEVLAYRAHVDAATTALIETAAAPDWARLEPLLELGLNHEQQHQELILMDIKHVFWSSPLRPAYKPAPAAAPGTAPALAFVDFDGGLVEIGHDGTGFAFDNESPRHRVWLEPFRLAGRLSTCGEYLAFIEDDGYARPELWLSDGWSAVQHEGWTAPLYWSGQDGGRSVFTLSGTRPLDPAEPVCHLSYYEADAFARWSDRRLPSEAEWELASARAAQDGRLADGGLFHPRPAQGPGLTQMIGDLWEWTGSPYVAYPRYRPPAGAVGEYNGKFMSGQMVLRGGAAVTPAGHVRPTYRNFFPPGARWAFSGVRLAQDA
jgi:ergothioneine biosynthesis protein EgtB